MSSEAIPIETARSHESRQPHEVAHLWCRACRRTHVSVHPVGTPVGILHCSCGATGGTLEVLSEREAQLEARVADLEDRLAAMGVRS